MEKKNKEKELLAMLVEIEIAGSFITSFISFEWMHPYVAQYHVWKVKNRVRRWKRWKALKDTLSPIRKSFKERLEEKQALANHHGYQPTDKVDTSNPPKETGT